MVLTVTAGLASSSSYTYAVPIILGLAMLKFIGVAFGFMEMKKANPFWKALIIASLLVFCGIILVAL